MDKELIEPLMLKASSSMEDSTLAEFCKRFAALVAEECAKACEDLPCWRDTPNTCAAAIREKFGVKT